MSDSPQPQAALAEESAASTAPSRLLKTLREVPAHFRKRFVALWHDDENALLFRSLVGLMIFISVVLGGTGIKLWQALHPHSAAIEKKAEPAATAEPAAAAEGEKKEEGTHDSGPALGVRAVPGEISERQDGVEEGDKDLVETEPKAERGLASLKPESDEPKELHNPFVTYNDILASTSQQNARTGRLALDVSFEADSYPAMKELQEREKEVKFLIASLVSELSYDQLRGDEGRVMLKKRIYQEVNFMLKKGKVKDVLYGNYVMR